jgi:hypothetical protein
MGKNLREDKSLNLIDTQPNMQYLTSWKGVLLEKLTVA